MIKTVIFDVDGTLVDSEKDGHLPACNDAFAALDLPVHWSWNQFKKMLSIPGNANRLRYWLKEKKLASEFETEALVGKFADLKKKFYIEKYLPALPLRPGVEKIVDEMLAADLRLAIVSTSYEQQIHALLRARLPRAYPAFQPILGKESGAKTGNDGMLYEKCIDQLACHPAEALVIEDSEAGFLAARKAGLACAVFYNDDTFGQNFSEAVLVARSLEFFNLKQFLNLCYSPSN